jgi:hypothetical protein
MGVWPSASGVYLAASYRYIRAHFRYKQPGMFVPPFNMFSNFIGRSERVYEDLYRLRPGTADSFGAQVTNPFLRKFGRSQEFTGVH